MSVPENTKAAKSYGGSKGVHHTVEEDLDALSVGKDIEMHQDTLVEISNELSMRPQRHSNDEYV